MFAFVVTYGIYVKSSDKGKGRAKSIDSPMSLKQSSFSAGGFVASGSRDTDINDTLNAIPSAIESLDLNAQSSEIARLKEQLAQQRKASRDASHFYLLKVDEVDALLLYSVC